MDIKQYTWEVIDSNSWLITENHQGLLVDAVDNQELYEAIMPLETLNIILTHCHFDHIVGLNRIREFKPDTKVIATKLCSDYIGNIYRNMSASANAYIYFYKGKRKSKGKIEPFVCEETEIIFEDNLKLQWHGHKIDMTAVHGHSKDSLLALLDESFLFTGDTLLHTPTVTRLPGGSTKRFWENDFPILQSYQEIEQVFPGHGRTGKLLDMIRFVSKSV